MENVIDTSRRTIDVQKIVDESPLSVLQWIVFVLSFFVIAADGLDTGIAGFIAPALVKEWGITRPELGPVLSAALFGMAIGALVAGPLADRLGRKGVVCLTVFFFGGASLLAVTSSTVGELTFYRFLTGLGLGAAMPNMATLLAEYMPKRVRATMVNIMFCAFPLGIAVGGFISSQLIPLYGWRSMMWVGGAFPLVLLIFLVLLLPDSMQIMVVRKNRNEKISRIIKKISPQALLTPDTEFVTSAAVSKNGNGRKVQGGALVLSKDFRMGTFMLWLTCFMSLLVFYLLTSWLTTLLTTAGLSIADATSMAAIFPVGGVVGAIVIGYLMDRVGGNKTLLISYALAAIFLVLAGLSVNNPDVFRASIFLSGAMVGGAQSSIPALTAAFYPVEGRATGVSWMHGIGRFGAIVGTFIGAGLLKMNLNLTTILMLLAIPAVIACAALVGKSRIQQKDVM